MSPSPHFQTRDHERHKGGGNKFPLSKEELKEGQSKGQKNRVVPKRPKKTRNFTKPKTPSQKLATYPPTGYHGASIFRGESPSGKSGVVLSKTQHWHDRLLAYHGVKLRKSEFRKTATVRSPWASNERVDAGVDLEVTRGAGRQLSWVRGTSRKCNPV